MPKNLSLHGARGLAALAVFLIHIHNGGVTAGFTSGLAADGFAWAILRCGFFALDVFFMISGYVIPASLARRGAAEFLISRAQRLYPTFLPPHLLVFVIGPIIGYKWMQGISPGDYVLHFLSNLFFLPGLFPLPIAQIVAWTLSYDVAFYLFAAAAQAIGGARCGAAARGGLWAIWLALAGTTLWHHPQGWFFVIGFAVYYAHQKLRWRADHWLLTCVAGPAALAWSAVAFHEAFWLSPLLGLAGFWALCEDRGWTARVLHSRWVQYQGDISYSFYLWHSMMIFGTKRVFAALAPSIGHEGLCVAAFGLVTLGLSLIVSHVSYRICEQWMAEVVTRRTRIIRLPATHRWVIRKLPREFPDQPCLPTIGAGEPGSFVPFISRAALHHNRPTAEDAAAVIRQSRAV
jgi:peptidoglycan/LPS O-acetylase OafA/YrhL